MNISRAKTDNSPFRYTQFDIVIERLLVVLLIFMPFAFGARDAWSEEVVILLSGAMAVCFSMKLLFHRSQPVVWSWTYVPAVLFISLVILQLLPLPCAVAEMLSPNTVIERRTLLQGLPDANRLLETVPLSFYRHATWHDLRLVLCVITVYVVVVNVFRQPRQIKRLLKTIALIGGAVALLAILQDLFGNGKFYWFIEPQYSNALRSGPFVNRNHYAQFMALSVGAGLAYVCVHLHEAFAHRNRSLAVLCEYLGARAAREIWLLVGLMVLCVATALIGMSRGGTIGLVVAGTLTVVLLSLRSPLKGSGWIVLLLAITAFACMVLIGLDGVIDRFANLGDEFTHGSRAQILRDLTAVYRRFPVFGTGLGTHSVVYPMFKRIQDVLLYTHAENEYAQMMEEMGIAGLSLLASFGLLVIYNGYRCLRRGRLPVCSAVYGLVFGLAAILVQSLTDYGQHIPANAMLSIVFCALLVGLGRHSLAGLPADTRTAMGRPARFLRPAFLVAVAAAYLGTAWAADRARAGEASWSAALNVEESLKKQDWKGNEAEYGQLLLHAAKAVEYQPHNVLYLHWLAVYRWHALDPQANVLGELTTQISSEQQQSLDRIVHDLHHACATCPTYGPPYSVVGQIELFVLCRPSGAENIRRGFLLSPSDPASCLIAGRLDVLQGDIEAAVIKFERAMNLDGQLFKEIVDIYANDLSRPDLAIAAAQASVGKLAYVAQLLDGLQYTDLATEAREKARTLLEAKTVAAQASAGEFVMLADFLKRDGENDRAVECYRQALAMNYGQVGWRLQLAELLMKMDRANEAMEEAKICLQLHPRYAPAINLASTLATHPAILNTQSE